MTERRTPKPIVRAERLIRKELAPGFRFVSGAGAVNMRRHDPSSGSSRELSEAYDAVSPQVLVESGLSAHAIASSEVIVSEVA